MSLSRSLIRWLLLGGLLVLVTLPRFDLHDPGPIKRLTAGATRLPYGHPIDQEGYIRLTNYFRGRAPADSMIQPYCYRPLVPIVASRLPFPPMTAINLVNLASLLATLVVLDRIFCRLGRGLRARTAGLLLFVVSFPTFYYGTIGMVDPAAVLLVSVGVLCTLGEQWTGLAAATGVGVLTKETNALIALLPGLWAWSRGLRSRAWIGKTIVHALIAGGVAISVRALLPFPGRSYFWWPQLQSFWDNLARPRAYLSLILTLGLPVPLALFSMLGRRSTALRNRPDHRFLLGGCALCALLYAASLFTAFADGRVIWIIYAFAVPLATVWLETPAAGATAAGSAARPETRPPLIAGAGRKLIAAIRNPGKIPCFLRWRYNRLFVRRVLVSGSVYHSYRGTLYPDYLNHGNACSFISEKAKRYCIGTGIDVGAGDWPLPGAEPVRDEPHQNAYRLDAWADRSLDYVFSSHCLEHLAQWQDALALWVSKLRSGGILFLYLPHPSMELWNPCGPWVGLGHQWKPSQEVLVPHLGSLGLEILESNPGRDEYWSFHIAARRR